MPGRQSPDTEAARTLLGHATAVATDTSLPEHIRNAAIGVAQQANNEILDHLRGRS